MRRILLGTSVVLSGVYVATLPIQPFPGSAVVKAASIALLAVLGVRSNQPVLAAALFASATGDLLLDAGPQWFVAGLTAFLVAHLCYTALFVRNRGPKRWPIVPAALAVYSAAFATWLWPSVGSLRVAVLLYILVITTMAIAAATSGFPASVFAGALLFLLSDSVLAAGRFKFDVPFGSYIVWSTYYAAQYLIANGVLSAAAGPRSNAAAA